VIAFACSAEFRGQRVSSPEPRKSHPAPSSEQPSPGWPCDQLTFRTVESQTQASLKSNHTVCFVANGSQAIEYRINATPPASISGNGAKVPSMSLSGKALRTAISSSATTNKQRTAVVTKDFLLSLSTVSRNRTTVKVSSNVGAVLPRRPCLALQWRSARALPPTTGKA